MNTLTVIYTLMFFFGFFFLLIFLLLHYKNLSRLYSYPKPTRYPIVSILVPAYNEEDNLEKTVDSLLKIEYPREKKEIIIINDESKDRTAEIAQKLASKHREIVFLDKKNSGKADSLNKAIKIARGEMIAVVDADSCPRKDALVKMVGYFDEKEVAAVTSRVLVKNKANWLERFQVMDYSIIAWTRKLLDFINSVYVTNGPLSVYRKEALVKVGGFDPRNLTEDIEVTWHLLSKGYRTRMSYSAVVYTTVPEKLKTWINQRVRWNLGGIQTISKYYKSMLKTPVDVFGQFVIPYVTGSFILAVIGIFLLARYIWIQGSYQAYALYYLFKGYNYFGNFEIAFYLTFLFFLGFLFFVFSIWYYKTGFRHSETGNKSILKILLYTLFYRSLYMIPLVLAAYKLIRGDFRWYTK